jgi:DNA-binding SARP family transcriptional activator
MSSRSLRTQEIRSAPDSVAICALGCFKLCIDNMPLSIGSDSKLAHLLLCVALTHSHRLPRHQLLERIWPEVEPALAAQSLNSVVHSLHKLTRPLAHGTELILYESGFYQLNRSANIWIDVEQFDTYNTLARRAFAQGDAERGTAYCQQALALYQGDLCGGADFKIVLERERLRVAFLDLLASLADHYHVQSNPTEALEYLQRLLAHDPCREDAHRLAMCCYMRHGRRAQALRQYHLCCQALALEFNVQPEPATTALFEQIRLRPDSL